MPVTGGLSFEDKARPWNFQDCLLDMKK
uniref:Uncharacterized protein n=1 Tax=Rhizophora mucronata TaxID=61149 RepID=A0A2P2N625_RHIMU